MDNEFSLPWQELYGRILAGQQKLYAIQYDNYSEWRARKLLGLRDSEATFHEVDRQRTDSPLAYAQAWRTFTDELVQLYVQAHERKDEAYGVGLALALEYQRGYAPTVDALPLPELLRPHGIVLKP